MVFICLGYKVNITVYSLEYQRNVQTIRYIYIYIYLFYLAVVQNKIKIYFKSNNYF